MTNSHPIRADRLNGRKLQAGTHSVAVLKKIGEGGSSFIYLAKRIVRNSSVSPTSVLNISSQTGYTLCANDSENRTGDDASSEILSNTSTIKMRNTGFLTRDSSMSISSHNADEMSTKSNASSLFMDIASSSKSTKQLVVLKATVTETKERLEQAKTEEKVLRELSAHPNILRLFEAGFFSSISMPLSNVTNNHSFFHTHCSGGNSEDGVTLHYLLLEYCDSGSLMDLIIEHRRIQKKQQDIQRQLSPDVVSTSSCLPSKWSSPKRQLRRNFRKSTEKHIFDWISGGFLDLNDILNIFRQIADAISFMHNRFVLVEVDEDSVYDVDDDASDEAVALTEDQTAVTSTTTATTNKIHRPIIHRDIKPENILLTRRTSSGEPHQGQWACKICDFGSAVEGPIPLHCAEDRQLAGDKIRRSTTQMYRAPEMIDLHMVDELTERTDVWALGCCLYAATFLQNCFGENSNLAILSGKFDIPKDHSYSHEVLIDLISRMLVVNPTKRATIDEVIECIDALLLGQPLPPGKTVVDDDTEASDTDIDVSDESQDATVATSRAVVHNSDISTCTSNTTNTETKGKKLNPDSVAARRKKKAMEKYQCENQYQQQQEKENNDQSLSADYSFSDLVSRNFKFSNTAALALNTTTTTTGTDACYSIDSPTSGNDEAPLLNSTNDLIPAFDFDLISTPEKSLSIFEMSRGDLSVSKCLLQEEKEHQEKELEEIQTTQLSQDNVKDKAKNNRCFMDGEKVVTRPGIGIIRSYCESDGLYEILIIHGTQEEHSGSFEIAYMPQSALRRYSAPVVTKYGLTGVLQSMPSQNGFHIVKIPSMPGMVCYLQPSAVCGPIIAAVGEKVRTPWGDGTVQKFRQEDNIYEVLLCWNAILFTHGNDVCRVLPEDDLRIKEKKNQDKSSVYAGVQHFLHWKFV